MLTVEQIMEKTNLKRGVIEHFRSILNGYGLIKNNEQLSNREVKVLINSSELKNKENITWKAAFINEIEKEYMEDLSNHFKWTNKIILRDLIHQINEKKVTVTQLINYDDKENSHHNLNCKGIYLFKLFIDNFVELSECYSDYSGSLGSDGNNALSFICQGADYQYYLIGKLNRVSVNDNNDENKDECFDNLHVFYNDSKDFNIMKCKYIAGGNSDLDIFK